MSRAERIKEEIGWMKVVFAVLIATDVSLAAWLAQNFDTESTTSLLAGLAVVIILSAGVIWTNRVVYHRLKELEKL